MESKQVQTIRNYFKICVDGKATERVGNFSLKMLLFTALIVEKP